MALVGSSLGWAPATQAHSSSRSSLACSGQENTRYVPGLTVVPRSAVTRGNVTYTCTDRPGHTLAATSTIAGVSPHAACVGLKHSRVRETLHYADGGTSVIYYPTSFGTRILGINTSHLEGTVIAGRYKGRGAVRNIQSLGGELPTACLTPEGLQYFTVRANLQIDGG
ncbi:hypothetical protein AB0F13_01185 [Streptomyces sp. NPDC026206]|uniref:hypothetical protein n=1 Tax=Streptomyces sp. NPDC026206 TaxID=3157089 RepID=UPI0033E10510